MRAEAGRLLVLEVLGGGKSEELGEEALLCLLQLKLGINSVHLNDEKRKEVRNAPEVPSPRSEGGKALDFSDVHEAVSVAAGKAVWTQTWLVQTWGGIQRDLGAHTDRAVRVACSCHMYGVHPLNAAHCLLHSSVRGESCHSRLGPGMADSDELLVDPLRLAVLWRVGSCQLTFLDEERSCGDSLF